MNHQITNNDLTVEVINQARWLFFTALLGIIACIVIFSFGATVLLWGKTSVGVFMTITSSVTTLPFVNMVKTAHGWISVARKQLQPQ